jgi:hypothetical protein
MPYEATASAEEIIFCRQQLQAGAPPSSDNSGAVIGLATAMPDKLRSCALSSSKGGLPLALTGNGSVVSVEL